MNDPTKAALVAGLAVALVSSEPCWYVEADPWEDPHFPTRAAADAAAVRLAAAGGQPARPARRRSQPCWDAACPSCATGVLAEDDRPGAHFATPAEAADHARREGWQTVSGRLLCIACQPTGVLPAGLTRQPAPSI